MLGELDLDDLRKIKQVSHYFRYPLHRRDFHDLRVQDQVRGHYAAKPLYNSLTASNRVDRSSGYSGDVASLFVPSDAASLHDVRLLLTHLAPGRVELPTGRRNWPAIRAAAESGIRQMLAGTTASQDYRLVPLTFG
jgi:hypothetical protein